jgi:hypothetical protein
MPDRRKTTVDIRELVLQMRQSDTDRAVQRTTGMHRQTVKRYRSWAAAHGLLTAAPLPALAELQQLVDATLAEPKPPQNTSSVEPHRALVQQLRQEGVEMTAVFVKRNGFSRTFREAVADCQLRPVSSAFPAAKRDVSGLEAFDALVVGIWTNTPTVLDSTGCRGFTRIAGEPRNGPT